MARWKPLGRLHIRRNWTFFAISYGWDVMSGNRSKSAFFEGGGSLWAQISEGRGIAHHCWYQKTRVIVLSCGIKRICSASFSFVTIQYTHLTDRQTECRQQYRAFCKKFHQVDTNNYISLNYFKTTRNKGAYCLSTFRLHVGSLHQDWLPVPVVSM